MEILRFEIEAGERIMTEYTGWLFTDVNRNISCPKCGAKAGEVCRTPKGRKALEPHTERVLLAPPEMVEASRRDRHG
jgi:hypothetical protein